MIKCTGRIGIWSVGFYRGRKTGVPREKPLAQGREPATNSTHMWRRVQESNTGHSGGRRVFSPSHHPCTPNLILAIIRTVRFGSRFFDSTCRFWFHWFFHIPFPGCPQWVVKSESRTLLKCAVLIDELRCLQSVRCFALYWKKMSPLYHPMRIFK